jgi:hypothetical protein
MEHKMKERSLFFPLALIAAGILWIMISMGKIPAENLWALTRIWPVLLIAAGLGLILKAYWPRMRMVIDVLVVGVAVLAVVYAGQFGWTTPQWTFGVETNFAGGARGSGQIVTETRNVTDFMAISVEYPADVVIKQGAAESVVITADDNLLPQLSTKMSMGTLVIRNTETDWNRRINPNKPVRIIVTVINLRDVDFPSAGNIRIEKLETESMNLRVSGAGSVTLDQLNTRKLVCLLSGAGGITASGVADDLNLDVSGLGSFTGKNLVNNNADVSLSGMGSASVHPKNNLVVSISGVGSVRYYGNPHISQQVGGMGIVNKMGE